MNHREELELALADAEVRLAEAVEARARLNADAAEISANIERARAQCRQARAALAELDRAEPERSVSAVGAEEQASPLAQNPRRPARRSRQEAIHRLIAIFTREFAGRGTIDWKLLARQAFMLLALVLAYLQYYFFGVNLQLVRLPTLILPFLSLHPLM